MATDFMPDTTPGTILTTTSSFDVDGNEWLGRLTARGFAVATNPHGRRLSEAEAAALLTSDVIGVIAGVESLTRAVLEGSKLRVVSRCGIGMDSVDLAAAAELDIAVRNTPDAPAPAVVELTIGLILDVLRRISASDRALRAGGWESYQGELLATKTLGIVGLGRIGRGVAEIAGAFGTRVVATDPHVADPPSGVTMAGFNELLAQADIVTLHVPGGADTRHLIDAAALAAMKPGAVLVNASRGGLVDEAAVVEALEAGRLGGAAFDTFEHEPYAGPLTEIDRTVLTCHMGSRAAETRARMETEAAKNLYEALSGLGLIDGGSDHG